MSNTNHVVTLGEWANLALAKHTRKIFKYEAKVPQDKDPEDLHQMRVGMRRLRSAIAGLAIALDLPQTVNRKNIAKVGRSLGTLRDLDVLLAALENDYRPLLPTAEQQSLDRVLKSLNKQRKRELKRVRQTLDSKLYLKLQQGLQDWLERPQYQALADLSIYPLLPDLLLPQIAQLLLHPGWLVGTETVEGQIQVSQMLDEKAIEQLSTRENYSLHDLRKLAKRNRYNLELFSQLYGDTYGYYVKQIEQIQEVLGKIQDCHVLKEVLEKVLKSALADKMPELANLLAQTKYQKWLEWQTLQKQFLDDRARQELRQAIQQDFQVES